MSVVSYRSIKLFLAFKFLHPNISLTQHYFKYEDVGTYVPVILRLEYDHILKVTAPDFNRLQIAVN